MATLNRGGIMKRVLVLMVMLFCMCGNAWGATEKSGLIYYPTDGASLVAIHNAVKARGLPAHYKLTYSGSGVSTPYIITSGVTFEDYETLEFENGAMLSYGSGVTLTFDRPEQVIAEPTQIIKDGSGWILFDNVGTIYANNWGEQTYDTVNKCYRACPSGSAAEGSNIILSGGTWDFGTNQLDLLDKVVGLEGISSGIKYDDQRQATVISHTGTDSAVRMNYASSFEKIKITGGAYGITLGNDSGTGAVAWGGVMRDCVVTQASTAGIKAYGIQLGLIENVFCEVNDSGVSVEGSGTNTHGTWINCRFAKNSEYGVYFGQNAQFKFYGCHFESNGFEGVKNENVALSGCLWDGCWLEDNNDNASHATGYFNMSLLNSNNSDIIVTNNNFNGAYTTGNGHISFQGDLTVSGNRYTGTSSGVYIKIAGTNDSLYNLGNDVLLDATQVEFSSQNNFYYAVVPESLRHSREVLLGGSFNNVPRLVNVTIVNDSGGVVTYNLPDAAWYAGPIGFQVVETGDPIYINPKPSDQIIPTCAVNTDIKSSGTIGDYLTLQCTTGSVYGTTYWQEGINIGTWTSE